MPITETINNIVRKRAQRLPFIKSQREHLNNILSRLNDLDVLLDTIKEEDIEQQGVYFSILQDNPKMRKYLSTVDTKSVRSHIEEQLKKLDILEKRFSRETVRIAMIGFERQGKSTFLQAISGLHSEKVIPAYSGTSCTGAVSVIHNIQGPFRVEIEPYSREQFLSIVRQKLNKFFPNRNFAISNPMDLQMIDLSGFTSPDLTLQTEFQKFKEAYCNHVEDYYSLLGRDVFPLTDENEVAKHVAQYERFDEIPEDGYDEIKEPDEPGGKIKYQKNYYKYVAVKHVDIYTQFDSIDTRKIDLVDTVGLGDAANADKIEKEMFRVLKEDCDAAVDLFQPTTTAPGVDKVQLDILNKISTELKGREPFKWIVYVINKNESKIGYNVPRCAEALKQFETAYDGVPKNEAPVAWAKVVNGKDVKDVQENLVIPLLELITSNLKDLDSNLMSEANEQGLKVFNTLYQLKENMDKVITSASKKGLAQGALFDAKMKELKDSLFPALRELDEENYRKSRNSPCPEIANSLNEVIEGLYDIVPSEIDIQHDVNLGTKNASGIYDNHCTTLFNRIFTEFESVTDNVIIPLREKVKMDMIELLFNSAFLGRIPLRDYSIKKGPSIEWLTCLLNEKVKKDIYPNFYEALNYILTYHFNIEDTIEYDVSSSIGIIDQFSNEYIPFIGEQNSSVAEKTDAIWQELNNRIAPLQEKLRLIVDRFALIPNHSFSTRVLKFRFKIVWGTDVINDMREFYRDQCFILWKDFAFIEDKAAAFGKWNDIANQIAEQCEREKFILKAEL